MEKFVPNTGQSEAKFVLNQPAHIVWKERRQGPCSRQSKERASDTRRRRMQRHAIGSV
jgi:hypothetical protein